MKIYLAGPMRGIPDFNFPAFFEGGLLLQCIGHYVHNPAYEDDLAGFRWRGTTGNEDMSTLWGDADSKGLKDVLAEDIEWILKHADAVAVLPGWEKSKGARAEVSAALAAGITVHPLESFIDEAKACDEITEVPPRIVIEQDGRPPFVTHTKLPARNVQPGEEIRITSSTGGQKGQKLAQLGSLDPLALLAVAEVSGFGAQKYARYNYLKGYSWSLSFDALQRHLLRFWSGEDLDPESGLPHLGHAAWHCLALLSFLRRDLGVDDRFKQAEA